MTNEMPTPEWPLENKSNVEKEKSQPLSCVELLREFEKKEALPVGKKLQFSGVGENDVYNISRPFLIGDKTVIAGRVEARTAWADSHVFFFEDKDGGLAPVEGGPVLQLEDGFVTSIEGEKIIGGVSVYPNPKPNDPQRIDYKTVFYRGKDLASLQKFTEGPENMKDIRLISLGDNRIGAFTRPQGEDNGNGKIGYIELSRLEDVNAQNLLEAKIIENQFSPEEWGGANELHQLPGDKIGVLGHIAYRDEQGVRHYHAMSFIYDPKMHSASPIKIIATRNNFPVGGAKNSELVDVVFPGGLVCHDDGTATLYAGLSDAEAGSIELPDPFLEKD